MNAILHDALCIAIGATARVIRASGISGEPLHIATVLLEAAMDAVERGRLAEASETLARLEEVPL